MKRSILVETHDCVGIAVGTVDDNALEFTDLLPSPEHGSREDAILGSVLAKVGGPCVAAVIRCISTNAGVETGKRWSSLSNLGGCEGCNADLWRVGPGDTDLSVCTGDLSTDIRCGIGWRHGTKRTGGATTGGATTGGTTTGGTTTTGGATTGGAGSGVGVGVGAGVDGTTGTADDGVVSPTR